MKALLKLLINFNTKPSTIQDSGFTLIEVLVVMIVLGILSAIAGPSWVTFTQNQRLNTAQSQVFRLFEEVKSTAKRNQQGYQLSFRTDLGTNTGRLQYSIHPYTPTGVNCNPTFLYDPALPFSSRLIIWKDLGDSSADANVIEMKGIHYVGTPATPPYRQLCRDENIPIPNTATVAFNSKGEWDQAKSGVGDNRFVVLRAFNSPPNPNGPRRCVTVTTLLGAVRSLKDGELNAVCKD
jgi:prepilin-type N-terminal cleavage/methylation domain-containing protein